VVVSAFDQLNHDHNSTVLDTFFKTEAEAVRTRLYRVDRCYRSAVNNGTEMKLFEDSVSVLVHKYLQAFYPLLEKAINSKNPSELLEKIVHNLINNIKDVSKHVIQCLIDLDDFNFEPTKLSFNRFSLMSSKELQAFLNTPLSPPSFEPLHKLGSNKKLQHQKLVQSTKIVNGTGNKYIHSDFLSFNLDVRDVNEKDLPESFDYRNQSVVGDVKDQKQGSICYIFATIAAMESSYMLLMRDSGKLKPGELVHFSEMDTLNCMINASLCDHSNNSQKVAQVVNYCFTKGALEKEYLQKALYKYGPLAVGIRINVDSQKDDIFFSQLAGELNRPCDSTTEKPEKSTNHAVLVVGWTPKYFIIKNSWGINWGIEGYLYMRYDQLRNCNLIGPYSKIHTVETPATVDADSATMHNSKRFCGPFASIEKHHRTVFINSVSFACS
ncbi:hypothetical protein TYRP_014725, partial [Tyrophagus putrescentiae]